MRALLVSACLALCSPAMAHGPWPWSCCSDRDCDEIAPSSVREYPEDDTIRFSIPPGGHHLWGKDKTTNWRVTIHRSQLKKPVTGEWGICMRPYSFEFICAFPPAVGG
jgi:hypothetical protein